MNTQALQISTAIKILLLGIMFMSLGALTKWSKWYWISFGVLAAFLLWWTYGIPH
jgi:hypothetical protein